MSGVSEKSPYFGRRMSETFELEWNGAGAAPEGQDRPGWVKGQPEAGFRRLSPLDGCWEETGVHVYSLSTRTILIHS